MATNRKNFFGVGLVPSSTSTNAVPGDTEYLSSDGKMHVFGASANDSVVMEALAATLTNKTLTAPVIATIVNSGTLTLPTSTDTLVGRATTDTLTNKSIDGNNNTLTNIPSGALPANVVYLAATQTLTNKTLTAPIIATIVNSGTLTLPTSTDTLVGRATTDTLTNKTLTSPIINTATADTITGIAGGGLTLASVTGQVVNLKVNATNIGVVSSTGLALSSASVLSLSNNSQTVSLQASASASASYTITIPAAAPTASTALVYNGSAYVWGQAGGWSLSSSTSLTGGGTISISLTAGQQVFRVAGTSAVTLSTTPFGSSAPSDATCIRLIGTDDVNTVALTNNDAAKGCLLKGNVILHKGDVIDFQYSTTDDRYFEISRNF